MTTPLELQMLVKSLLQNQGLTKTLKQLDWHNLQPLQEAIKNGETKGDGFGNPRWIPYIMAISARRANRPAASDGPTLTNARLAGQPYPHLHLYYLSYGSDDFWIYYAIPVKTTTTTKTLKV